MTRGEPTGRPARSAWLCLGLLLLAGAFPLLPVEQATAEEALPDLVPVDIRFFRADGREVHGQDVDPTEYLAAIVGDDRDPENTTVRATVVNNGSGPAENVTVVFYDRWTARDEIYEVEMGRTQIAYLAAGQTTNVSILYGYMVDYNDYESTKHHTTVNVSIAGDEADISNNERTEWVQVMTKRGAFKLNSILGWIYENDGVTPIEGATIKVENLRTDDYRLGTSNSIGYYDELIDRIGFYEGDWIRITASYNGIESTQCIMEGKWYDDVWTEIRDLCKFKVYSQDPSMRITFILPWGSPHLVGLSALDGKNKPGAPGAVVSFPLKVENIGTENDTISIALDDPSAGWETTLEPSSATLRGRNGTDRDSATAWVNVTVPVDAADGEQASFAVIATSIGNSSQSRSLTLTVTVDRPEYGLVLGIGDWANDLEPGASTGYTFTVGNTGNRADIFDLATVIHSSDWQAELNKDSVTLEPGQTGSATLTVTAPANATDGERGQVSVTVTSQADPAQGDSLTTTSTVVVVQLFPDLVVTAADLSLSNASPAEGDTVNLTVVVRNTGDVAATATVRFYDGEPDAAGTVSLGSETVTLAAGGAEAVAVSWVATEGNHTLHVVIADSEPAENDTANNRASVSLTVAAGEQVPDGKKPPEEDSPFLAMGGVLLALAVVGVLVKRNLRRK